MISKPFEKEERERERGKLAAFGCQQLSADQLKSWLFESGNPLSQPFLLSIFSLFSPESEEKEISFDHSTNKISLELGKGKEKASSKSNL